MVVEKLITRAKRAVLQEQDGGVKNVHARRHVFSFLRDREAVQTLFNEIAPKVAARPGGYTRVVKLGQRPGDGAEIAVLELVDYNVGQEKAAAKTAAKKTASSRKKKAAPQQKAAAVTQPAAETKEETVTPTANVEQEQEEEPKAVAGKKKKPAKGSKKG